MKNELITKIIKKRKELSLSQRDLAFLCGLPQSTIARIETEKISPTIETLETICNALKINLTIEEGNQGNIHLLDKQKQKEAYMVSIIAKENPDIKRVFVFGSAAKKTCTKESDIDIYLEVTDSYNKLRMHETAAKIGKACNYNCDLINSALTNDRFKETIYNEGVEIYGI